MNDNDFDFNNLETEHPDLAKVLKEVLLSGDLSRGVLRECGEALLLRADEEDKTGLDAWGRPKHSPIFCSKRLNSIFIGG